VRSGCKNAAVPGLLESASLQLRVAKRLTLRRGATIGERFGALDDRLVFVVGCPRSGTTFLAGAIGSLPGFVDLGEVAPVKASVPELVALPSEEAARRLHRTLVVARRVGLVGAVRGVEQTPEMAFLVDAAARAYPQARIVHIVRDGRDVACSLLARGWLSSTRTDADDAGLRFGAHTRFWVEPSRDAEFAQVSDARRTAWAWRRYVTAAREAEATVYELRYEQLVDDPDTAAHGLATYLGTQPAALAAALRAAHAESVGRHRTDLTPEQLADVMAEAGDVLRELGYTE
jgi:hypothetical protein